MYFCNILLELLKTLFKITCYLAYNAIKVSYTLKREFNKTLDNSIKDEIETKTKSKIETKTKTYIEKKNKLKYLYQECKYKKVLYSEKQNIM